MRGGDEGKPKVEVTPTPVPYSTFIGMTAETVGATAAEIKFELQVKELEEEALALRKKGHHQNAMIIYKEAYRLRVATLGPEADLTISSLADVAITLAMQEKYRLAASYLETVVRIGQRKWGVEKSFLRRVRQALQRMYDHLWMQAEARELALSLLEDAKNYLGEDSRETLMEHYSLGCHYYHWGHYEKSKYVFTNLYAMQVKAFGEKNTEALQTRNGIGACDSAMDNKESAKGHFNAVLLQYGDVPPFKDTVIDLAHKIALFSVESLARVHKPDRCHTAIPGQSAPPEVATPPGVWRCEPISLEWPSTVPARPDNVIREGDSGLIKVVGELETIHGYGEGTSEYSCFEDDGDGDLEGDAGGDE